MADTISIPLNAVPSDFDPQTMSDIYSMIANLQLHRGLMRFNSNLDVEPDIASSFSIDDNGKTVVFILKPDAKFSDGTAITSNDVVKTFRRMFKLKSAMAADLNYIVGSDKYTTLKVEAAGANRIVFRLKHPSSLFLKQLATVDSSILKLDDSLDRQLNVWSGPYKLKKVDSKFAELSIVNSEKYPKAPSTIRFVSFDKSLLDIKDIIKRYDTVDGIVLPDDKVLKLKQEGWKEVISTTANIFALVVNKNKVKKEYAEILFNFFYFEKDYVDKSNFIPVYTVVPPAISNGTSKFRLQKIVHKKIKNKVVLNLLVIKGGVGVEMLKSSFAVLESSYNIKVVLDELPIAEFLERVKTNNFEIRLLPKLIDYPDPYAMLSYFRSGYEANKFFISDREIDSMLDLCIAESDKSKRASLYDKIQLKILEKRFFIPLFSGSTQAKLWSNRVLRVPAHPMGLISLPFEKIEMK